MDVGLDGAGYHLEQRHLTDVLIGDRLENERQRLAALVGLDFDLLLAGVHDGRPIDGRWARSHR
jgi:hypothetical protein